MADPTVLANPNGAQPATGVASPASVPQSAATPSPETGIDSIPEVDAAKAAWHGLVGTPESAEERGTTTTASPEAADLGFTPGNTGYAAGQLARGVGQFLGGAFKDLVSSKTPVILPDEKNISWKDPKANTLLGKYITAPSEQERQAALKEAEAHTGSKGVAAIGHLLNTYIHTAGEMIPVAGPFAAQLVQKAENGDIGGAVAQVAALAAAHPALNAAKETLGLDPKTISSETHNIVAAPDGSKVAFPKNMTPEAMYTEMTNWWDSHEQKAAAQPAAANAPKANEPTYSNLGNGVHEVVTKSAKGAAQGHLLARDVEGNPDAARVAAHWVADTERGQGIGTAQLTKLATSLAADGKTMLLSDTEMTDSAKHSWDRLQTQNPDAVSKAGKGYIFDLTKLDESKNASQIAAHEANGGSTFTPEGQNLNGVDKYAVGAYPDRTESVGTLTPETLQAFKDKNQDVLSQDNHSVGTWHDPETGKHVLDVSKLYDGRDEAIAAGKAANQKSIYHLGGEGEIQTGGTGEPVKMTQISHWSKGKVPLTETDPQMFGTGRAGAERARANEPGFIPRTYFGMEGYNEPDVQSGLKHTASVDMSKFYNIGTDPDGVWAKGYQEGGATGAENAVKDAGYSGYYSPDHKVMASFDKLPVQAEEKPIGLKDLWTDESGTYTSGKFVKWLAKNNLSDQGQKVLTAASKEKIVPGWDEVSKFLTPEDRDQASAAIQKNVVSLVNSFNPEWVTEAAKAGSVAKGWYQRATALIQHMMGEDANRFTDFVASLSPQKDVEQNLTDALNFHAMWKEAGSPLGPDNADAIRDLVNRAETGMSGQVARNQLYDNLVSNKPPSGPKVSNFARNLKGEMDVVTKDRWMAYLFGNNERMFRWFKAGDPKPAAHLAADALVRAVGQHIGMLPAEVQETGWSFLRSVVNLSEKEGISTNEAVNRINEGNIKAGSSELTRLVSDSPKVRAALNNLSYVTGNEQLKPSTLESSPAFKRLLKEHVEQTSTAGGLGAANRDVLKRGVKSAVKARSALAEQKTAQVKNWKEREAAKAAPRDKATEFNPADMSSNITPALREKMQSALA